MKNINILVINPLWPHPNHSIRAANVVLFELISEFAKQQDVKVMFLKINKYNDPAPSDEENRGVELLQSQGVNILPAFTLPLTSAKKSALSRILFADLADFYPEIAYRAMTQEKIVSYKPDVLFIPWTEWMTALCADMPVLKFAYYGNPDAKSVLAMTEFNFKHGTISFFRYLIQKYFYKKFEKLHLAEMANYEILGDVAANDAQYYKNHGHKNAFYIQNVWIDRFREKWREKRKIYEQTTPPIIVGNIGKLAGTANTHGLEILGKDILPSLKNLMKNQPYEVHLFGAGSLHPAVAPKLNVPEVRMRGFVDDIDAELLKSRVFLCVNNGSVYKVGHTRYLHAWSLGCCVVAHKDAALSMPEIVHDKNALLGQNPAEIANLIKTAIEDPGLRARIGEGGYNTFKEYFVASSVAPKILDKIKKYESKN